MEEKIDLLTENISRGLQEREDSAQQIKRYSDVVHDDVTRPPCIYTYVCLTCAGCSLIEQKVDQMAVELTKRQLEREDTALQYKR